jgi:hypothetical protein
MTLLAGMVWDACTTLNLMATDRAQEILTAFGSPSCIVKQVREGEVFTLRPLPEDDPKGILVPVDLAPLITAGVLQEVEMTPAEQTTFVAFAAEVDDGEARSSAVAVHRGLTLVTDDKASIRLVQSLANPVAVMTTLDWIKWWVDEQAVDDATLGAVLRRIEICAHYRPRRNHPLKSWWEAHLP